MKKLRSFSQFDFFAHRFRPFAKNIFGPAEHPFSSGFVSGDRARKRANGRACRVTAKSIVVQNVTMKSRTSMPATGLQAASLLGLRDVAIGGVDAEPRFGYICV
jgi:hypothetical protein